MPLPGMPRCDQRNAIGDRAMQERGERYRGRMVDVSEKVAGSFEVNESG